MRRAMLLAALLVLDGCSIELVDRVVPDDVPVLAQRVDGVIVLAPGQVAAIGDRLVMARPAVEEIGSIKLGPRRALTPRARPLVPRCAGCPVRTPILP